MKRLFRKSRNMISRLIGFLNRHEKTLWPWAIIALAAIGSVICWQLWDQLQDQDEPISTTIRNVALILGGLVAVLLAMWRSRVAERQADTAQQGLLYDRYQRGAQMLGDKVLAVRMAGIYSLQSLAEEHPAQYHIQIIQLFCAFVRNPTYSGESHITNQLETTESPNLRQDVQAVMDAIGRRGKERITLEIKSNNYRLDLTGADLRGAKLERHNLSRAFLRQVDLSWGRLGNSQLNAASFAGAIMFRAHLAYADLSQAMLGEANLSEAFMQGATLTGTYFMGSDLSNAFMYEATLSEAKFWNAELTDAQMQRANFSRASFRGANLTNADLSVIASTRGRDPISHGLTQAQLDEAVSDPNNPPHLRNLLDAETHKPLVWHGRSPDEKPRVVETSREGD